MADAQARPHDLATPEYRRDRVGTPAALRVLDVEQGERRRSPNPGTTAVTWIGLRSTCSVGV